MFSLAFPILNIIAFAAHLFYHGYPLAAALAGFVFLVLLFIPRNWARRCNVATMAVIAFEWVRTAVSLGILRAEYGMPWERACAILLGVALIAALSATVFFLPRLKDYYRSR